MNFIQWLLQYPAQCNSCGISGYSLISLDNVHFDLIKKKSFPLDLSKISVFLFLQLLRVNARIVFCKAIQNKFLARERILIWTLCGQQHKVFSKPSEKSTFKYKPIKLALWPWGNYKLFGLWFYFLRWKY